MNNIMDGKALSLEIQDELKKTIKYEMIKPSVAVIQIGDDAASNTYIRNKEKACNDVGIFFRHFKFEDGTPELTVINKIKELNNDEYVNGIIIQLPLPERYNEKRLVNQILNSKDIDGLTDINVGRLLNGKKTLVPCTPLGVMELLEKYNVNVEGKHVVIVGKGKLTGKPLAHLLLNAGATVTVCHSRTLDLASFTRQADILISATGLNKIITEDMVKKDAVVIDIGINYEDGHIAGDVDFANVSKKASLITPVPGGVGPMTIAMLLKNIVNCYYNKKK
ncbi:MAG: bifunctional 5,10-methylenetetrahydrofolate dehydrogenase/5,10-methenyltetrahydrofolate cyclohydrolase [Bacilli bacterium]|nr:bifunctional 5,10-methylenetetrahydrofolate dehydrogenase/5,10-methenyltetrahydrofolate cyclohydrolase [Bacilli bacterium]